MSNYLYNGVELPALPEWDKTQYPYIVMTKNSMYANLYIFAQPKHLDSGDTGKYIVSEANEYHVRSQTTSLLGGVGEDDYFREPTVECYSNIAHITNAPMWANYDIYNADGTLYLAGTNPFNAETGEEIHDYEIKDTEPEQPERTDLTANDLYCKVNGQLVKLKLFKNIKGELVAVDEFIKEGTNE